VAARYIRTNEQIRGTDMTLRTADVRSYVLRNSLHPCASAWEKGDGKRNSNPLPGKNEILQ
jgi:hypothetical protein